MSQERTQVVLGALQRWTGSGHDYFVAWSSNSSFLDLKGGLGFLKASVIYVENVVGGAVSELFWRSLAIPTIWHSSL